VLSLAALLVGVTMTFNVSPSMGIGTLVVVAIAVPAVAAILLHYAPKTPVGKRFFLQPPAEDTTLATSPAAQELEQLRGRFGRTISWLRPAGVTDFDGQRIDTISEGPMIEPGKWVQCIDVQSGKVIVRQVSGPPDLGNFDATTLT
jgi:membrane-bound serine protease (ClpP class)